MDNIVFEKVWQNDNLIELKISASSEFVSAYQNCYVEQEVLEDTSDKICDYIYDHSKPCYVELGKKSGNFTPAFSMCILPAEKSGHMKIEVDIEIADNDMRIHRCCFYVKSELGLVEQFGVRLKNLAAKPVGIKVALSKGVRMVRPCHYPRAGFVNRGERRMRHPHGAQHSG